MNLKINRLRVVGQALVMLAVATVHWSSVRAQDVNFWQPSYNYSGDTAYPLQALVADVNGDGKPDLILVDEAWGALTVLTNYNDGSGAAGFLTGQDRFYYMIQGKAMGYGPYSDSAWSWPTSLAAADVNGDGKIDLIFAWEGSNTVMVATNNGQNFSSNAVVRVGNGPSGVVAVDINGHGKPDLVTANYYDSTVTVLTNNGKGFFGSNATVHVGTNPVCIVTADVNGDGTPDLITASAGVYSNYFGTLTILTNNGHGIFGSNATVNAGVNAQWVIAADVNGDGKPDLVTANGGVYPNYAGTLIVLTNNGSGVFGSNATLIAGKGTCCVAAADINGDGSLDLISANPGDSTLTIFTNDRSGVFGSNTVILLGGGSPYPKPAWVTAAFLSGDGKPDLVTANGAGNSASALINLTSFPFLPPLNLKMAGNQKTVSWGAWNTNYILETATDPGSGSWTAVTNPAPVAGLVTFTNALMQQFFRLHQF
jgi:hypothetical protein